MGQAAGFVRLSLPEDGGLLTPDRCFPSPGVDLELWAHEHTYERLWPVYGDKVGSCLPLFYHQGPFGLFLPG